MKTIKLAAKDTLQNLIANLPTDFYILIVCSNLMYASKVRKTLLRSAIDTKNIDLITFYESPHTGVGYDRIFIQNSSDISEPLAKFGQKVRKDGKIETFDITNL